jgi:hypothetical protein
MSTSRPQLHTYAIRRLSPFLGVLHILNTEHGMAVTANGIDWQVQVKIKTRTPGWGSLDGRTDKHGYCVCYLEQEELTASSTVKLRYKSAGSR